MNAIFHRETSTPLTVVRELHADSVLFTMKLMVALFTMSWGVVVVRYPDVFGSFPSYRALRALVDEDTLGWVTIIWSALQMLRLLHAAAWPFVVAGVLDVSFAVFWGFVAWGIWASNATPPPVGGGAAMVLAVMSACAAVVMMSARMGEARAAK